MDRDFFDNAPKDGDEDDWDKTPDPEEDPLFVAAVRVVVDRREASINLVQARLAIGYQRALRMFRRMETLGYISPPIRGIPRQVFLTHEKFVEIYGYGKGLL